MGSTTQFSEVMVNNALKQLGLNRDTSIEQYQEGVLDAYQSLLDKVTMENEMIKKSYPGISVSGRKSIYLDQSSKIFITINKWLFWIYIGLAIILSIMIILKPFSIYLKISMIVVIVAFPFYIYPLETGLYELLIYIYSVLLSVTYNNGYKIK